jgi:uncharacterized RDD family membrane protein YckC
MKPVAARPKVGFASPEGIALQIELARPIERLGALVVDLLLVVVAVAVFTFAGVKAGLGEPHTLGWLGIFAVRHVYFLGFETRWQGVTPGKRMFKLKVIARYGGLLDARALFARTLMRDVELVVPVLLLMSIDATHHPQEWVASIPAALWVIAVMLLPVLHPERMRAGDLVAGTVVVRLPAPRSRSDEAQAGVCDWSFTPAQLSIYGERELAALADLLRRSNPADEANRRVLDSVARTICIKLDVPGEHPTNSERFLRTFYGAQRTFLEHRRRLGRRKPDKGSPYEEAQRPTRSQTTDQAAASVR